MPSAASSSVFVLCLALLGVFFMFSFFPLNFFGVELMVHLPGNQKMQGMSRLPEAKSKRKQSPAAWFCPLLELE